MNQKVKALEAEQYTDRQIIDQLEAQVEYCYTPVFVRNRLAVYSEKWDWEQLTNQEQVTLKRQAASIIGKKVKVTDEDHPISFP
jgi:DNA-binding HxlR family transcriptional regulator